MISLDKNVNDLFLNFEMFQGQVNNFACLKTISNCLYKDLGLENEEILEATLKSQQNNYRSGVSNQNMLSDRSSSQ